MPTRRAPRRLGRPPAAESGATRERILVAARKAFAEVGFAATTNKVLADGADVTTGAIYHYFDSKLDLYRAVYDEAQAVVYARFDETVEAAGSFVDGMEAILEAAHALNNEDPSLARFLGAVRVDVRRNPELRSVLRRPSSRRDRFVQDLVQLGVESGEITPADAPKTTAMVLTLLVGLVDAVSDSPVTHRAAIDAMKLMIEGTLVRTPARRGPATRTR